MPKRKGPTLTAPDVWRHHPPESMERSTYALAALSVQLQHDPETWATRTMDRDIATIPRRNQQMVGLFTVGPHSSVN